MEKAENPIKSRHNLKSIIMGFESAPGKIEKTCPSCGGSGKDKEGNTCKTCHGKGTVNKH